MAMKESGASRGVEHPIATDMALIGDTRMEGQTKSLPRLVGPNFGYGKATGGSEERDDEGCGSMGEGSC